jgi:hypothetical protein
MFCGGHGNLQRERTGRGRARLGTRRCGWVVHAWAEIEDAVYDLTESEHPMRKADYYQLMGVREHLTRRYGRVEYFTLMAETGSMGPFDTKFFFANQTAFLPQA